MHTVAGCKPQVEVAVSIGISQRHIANRWWVGGEY
jgi:hypothetical protein